jgi:hypothetical protein
VIEIFIQNKDILIYIVILYQYMLRAMSRICRCFICSVHRPFNQYAIDMIINIKPGNITFFSKFDYLQCYYDKCQIRLLFLSSCRKWVLLKYILILCFTYKMFICKNNKNHILVKLKGHHTKFQYITSVRITVY